MSENDLRPRYNALVEATVKQNTTLEVLRSQIEFLKTDNARLTVELAAAHNNAQLLGDELNLGNQDANREVERLRALLKENGIDPGDA
jgi:FtsZ-binding cell division protein ZapB